MKNKNNTEHSSHLSRKRKEKIRKKRMTTIGLSVLAGSLLLAGIFTGIGVYAVNGNNIYPNIIIGDVPVGDMTVDQAARELDGAVSGNLTDKSVTVILDDGVTLEITGEQAGLSAVPETAASQAYEYGRDGNVLTRAFTYLRCHFGSTKLDAIPLLKAEEEMVRDVLQTGREQLDQEHRVPASYEITEDSVIVNRGTPGVAFDEQEAAKAVCRAFENGQDSVNIGADLVEPEPVDLDELYEAVFIQPEDAVYDKDSRKFMDHTEGIGFDREEARKLVEDAPYGEAVSIPLTSIEPEITKEKLEKEFFPDVLCTSTTNLKDEPNILIDDSLRTMNVDLASGSINGTILEPGERFEFNKVVGQRTAERGYQLSDAYAGTEVVTQLGGGICQVSSTLYHALLHTDIEINKRRNHTLTVAYLPLGMDATVSWGNPEFAFTNNTGHPVKIEMIREGDALTATVRGTQTSDIKIVPRYVEISSTPFSVVYKDDPSMPANETRVEREGLDGYVVDVYKDYMDADDNVIKSVHLGRDTYKPMAEIVRKGTGAAAQ